MGRKPTAGAQSYGVFVVVIVDGARLCMRKSREAAPVTVRSDGHKFEFVLGIPHSSG